MEKQSIEKSKTYVRRQLSRLTDHNVIGINHRSLHLDEMIYYPWQLKRLIMQCAHEMELPITLCYDGIDGFIISQDHAKLKIGSILNHINAIVKAGRWLSFMLMLLAMAAFLILVVQGNTTFGIQAFGMPLIVTGCLALGFQLISYLLNRQVMRFTEKFFIKKTEA